MKYLDIDQWNRKKHFHNFLHYTQPFFNITANVEVTEVKALSAEKQYSFFLSYYFIGLQIINEIEALRYRIREEQVIVHDVIHGSCAILNADNTFSYAYFDYDPSFNSWHKKTKDILNNLRENPSLDPQFHRDDLIHATVIPWISFTNFEHAKRLEQGDSTPKLVFGKSFTAGNRLMIPISLAVHHALADGFHVGQFFEKYEWYANNPSELLR